MSRLCVAPLLIAGLLCGLSAQAQDPPPKTAAGPQPAKKTTKTADPHAGHDHPPGEHPENPHEADPHAGHGHPPGMHGKNPHGGGAAEEPEGPFRSEPWPKSVLRTAAKIPVQANGRIKPLDTYAGFVLLKLNGRRKLETPKGERIGPVAWLLDTMLFPSTARKYPCFRVQNSDVVIAAGLEGKKKRDYYSYAHLEPGLKKLFELANEANKKAKEKGGVSELEAAERETLELAKNVSEYQLLLHAMDWARQGYTVSGVALEALFGKVKTVPLGTILQHPKAVQLLAAMFSGKGLPEVIQKVPGEVAALRRMAGQIQLGTQRALVPALFPPSPQTEDHDHDHKRWYSTVEVVGLRLTGKESVERQVKLLRELEALEQTKLDMAAFEKALETYQGSLAQLATERGEYDKIPLEVAFYRGDFFYRALVIYLFALLILVFSWVFPQAGLGHESAVQKALKAPKLLRLKLYNALRDPLYVGVWGLMILGTVLVVTGITLRCIINSRPPVTTLYETILFICGCSVITALAIEYINRQRIALAVSVFLGAALLFLAGKYEFKAAQSAGDTLEPMRAVLDTNFWLATHVTTVTLGYAAGLLAAAIAHVWLLGKMFGLKQGNRSFYRTVSRMTYGVLCFGLLFSVVGTILGGIWANYSWGRFWGWDPKENGALLIVLWELAILHARLGGYLRDHGLAVMSILGGCVVAFSWWGVNLLNVGLHSYGFTTGVALVLGIFMFVEVLLVIASGAWRLGQAGLPSEDAPGAEKPTKGGETKAEEPKGEEPKAEEPKAEEPKAEEPKAEEPKAEEPKAEEPKADDAKAEEPTADDDAKAEEPKADDAKAEEPKAEEPKADDDAKAEEPKADDPKADEPEGQAEQPEGQAEPPEGTAEDPGDGEKKD